ncbi:MAG TPA: HEAT repeat domain-containing protein [Deltaproteobacteria bacterium]|nr:HEAT repeat domain-containing protein [Deltaproteobacteria bacterium]
MQKETIREDILSEAQEALRYIIAAVRAVRMYPPNNPVYSNSIKKSFETLQAYFNKSDKYQISVQKNSFSLNNAPHGKETEQNKPIAHDLFTKEIREIFILSDLTEQELTHFYQALALPMEKYKLQGGLSSILWEKDVSNIKVTEAGIEEIITTPFSRSWEEKEPPDEYGPPPAKKDGFPGRVLVIIDLAADPAGFSANMIELAKQTKEDNETIEDKLFALYKEAGNRIDTGDPTQRETLYQSLAKSVLALDPLYRNGFIAGKLYGELDTEMLKGELYSDNQYLPSIIQEIQSGRFSDVWTVQQVAALLKKSVSEPTTDGQQPVESEAQVISVSEDILESAESIAKYNNEDMEELQELACTATEKDIMKASTQTVINLLSLFKLHSYKNYYENNIKLFSAFTEQFENSLEYYLKQREYDFASNIIKNMFELAEGPFQAILSKAFKIASFKYYLVGAIDEVRKYPKDSNQYKSAYRYLALFDRESTEILLELMAEEKDRALRIFYLDLAKNIGKDQTTLLGKHLVDNRWYVVRNIVSIIGETKSEQAMKYLCKAAQQKNMRVRQEVIQGIAGIGGPKAAIILASFLDDKDKEVKLMALKSFSSLANIGPQQARHMVEFLEKQPLKKKEQKFTLEAIKALGKIGDISIIKYLQRYDNIRWWKSRKLQKDLRAAARQAREEISRRQT